MGLFKGMLMRAIRGDGGSSRGRSRGRPRSTRSYNRQPEAVQGYADEEGYRKEYYFDRNGVRKYRLVPLNKPKQKKDNALPGNAEDKAYDKVFYYDSKGVKRYRYKLRQSKTKKAETEIPRGNRADKKYKKVEYFDAEGKKKYYLEEVNKAKKNSPKRQKPFNDKVVARMYAKHTMQTQELSDQLMELQEKIDYNMMSSGAETKANLLIAREQAASYRKNFSGTAKIANSLTGGLVNRVTRPLTRDEKEWLGRYTVTRAKVKRIFAAYLKNMSGTAASDNEVKRLQSAVISGALSPTQAKAMLNDMVVTSAVKAQALREGMNKGPEFQYELMKDRLNPNQKRDENYVNPAFKSYYMKHRYKFDQGYKPYKEAFMGQNPDATSNDALRTYTILQMRRNNADAMREKKMGMMKQMQQRRPGMASPQPGMPHTSPQGPRRNPMQFGQEPSPGSQFNQNQQQQKQQSPSLFQNGY